MNRLRFTIHVSNVMLGYMCCPPIIWLAATKKRISPDLERHVVLIKKLIFARNLGCVRLKFMHDLTAFQRDVLYVVAGEENLQELAIKEELDEYYGDDINDSRLYPNLSTLVDKGLLREQETNRETSEYSLTDRGSREISARRRFVDSQIGSR